MEASQTPKKKRVSAGKLLALSAAALTLVGVILTLLGFGVALAASGTFGIPYNLIVQSPFDALVLSVPVVAMGVINWFALDMEIYAELLHAALPILGFLVVGKFAAPIFVWLMARRKRRPFTHGGWLTKLTAESDPSKDSFGLTMARAISAFFVWAVALPLGTFVTLLLLGTACLIVALIPTLGNDVGRAYLHSYVIAAEACIPIRTSAEHIVREAARRSGVKRESRPGATCVRVARSDGTTVTGRVALSTSNAILLYDPTTGVARRIPTSDAVIESVDEIPTAADSQNAT